MRPVHRLMLVLALTAAISRAGIIYENSTNDQNASVSFSASGVTKIGDQIHLSTASTLDTVTVQFFNFGTDATFDAVLEFFGVGSPVGTPIGGPFTVTGVSIGGGASQSVMFYGLGLAVPQDVVFMLAAQNVSNGGDIGVNLFDPPTVGSSSNAFYLTFDGTSFSQASTNLNIDNLYAVATTAPSEVPEPGTAAGVTIGMLLLAWWRRRS